MIRTLTPACLAAALFALSPACRRATPDGSGGSLSEAPAFAPVEDAATPDPSALVLAFSLTGRTALVAEELGAMVGARVVVLPAPAESDGRPPGQVSVEGLPGLAGVKRLYLGFPIRTGAPAPEATAALDKLALAGVELVPFFTYLHHASSDAVAAWTQLAASKGATVRAPIALRFALSTTSESVRREARRALLAKDDLWPREAPAEPRCAARPGTTREACVVPAGFVWTGDDASDASPVGAPAPRRLRVEAFELDRAEVTVAAYRDCAGAGRCPPIEPENTRSCTTLVGDRTDLPMPCVGRREAEAFCAWAGGRVPKEAEWMRAARADGLRAYPWGAAAPGASEEKRGNFGEKSWTGLPTYELVPEAERWPSDGFAGLSPGCGFTAGDGPFGHCDLAGNLAEWATTATGRWVLKGGSWLDGDAGALRIATRGLPSLGAEGPAAGFYLTGLRCAYAPRP